MDSIDRQIIKLTQDGILIESEPFKEIARHLNISENEIIQRIKHLQYQGVIRRFGASIGHRGIGITANAMCTWNVPDERVEDIGAIMAGFTEVTHCYERPKNKEWPFNLYTMVHAYTHSECEKIAAQISSATGITDYKILFSEKEFKKTGVRI
jgi:DNA-binding Lrp family transcriptional regulator